MDFLLHCLALYSWFHHEYFHTWWALASRIGWAVSFFIVVGILIFARVALGFTQTNYQMPSDATVRIFKAETGWMSDNDFRFVMTVISNFLLAIFILAGRIDLGIFAVAVPRTLLILTWCWKKERRWLYFQAFAQLLLVIAFPLHSFELAIFSFLCNTLERSFIKPSLEYVLKFKPTIAMGIEEAESRRQVGFSSTVALKDFCDFGCWEKAEGELQAQMKFPVFSKESQALWQVRINSETGRLQKVVATYEEASKKEQEKLIGHLGVAYALAGEKVKAIDVAEEIITLKRKWNMNWGLAGFLGRIYSEIGDNMNALKWTEIDFRQFGERRKRYLELAHLYRKSGDLHEARFLFDRYVRWAKYFPKAELEELSELCREMDDAKSADYYERLSKLVNCG